MAREIDQLQWAKKGDVRPASLLYSLAIKGIARWPHAQLTAEDLDERTVLFAGAI